MTLRLAYIAAFGIVAAGWLVFFSPIVSLPGVIAYLPPFAAAALSVVSVGFSYAAVHTLGREWSYQARLVEGHRLVIQGPYRIVRHPIYSAMIGKLIAIGIW